MAENNRRVISLGLDYSNFTGGVTECNRNMQLLNSQFRLSSAQIHANGTEADQLRLNHERLTQAINIQTQRVNIARASYDQAVASGNATERQLDSLRLAVIRQETALQNMNNELAQSNESTEDAGKQTESFGDSIRGLASSLGLEVSPAIENLAKKFDGVSKEVGNATVGIAAIATAFVKCSIDAAAFADDLLTLSTTTHITTDELQKMQYASNLLDVDVDTMTGAMKKLTQNMNTARNGNKELNEVFKKLRITYKEHNGELKDANEIFYATIDALGKVKNETERDALAMKLLGKSAQELNPLIEAGSKRLKELGVQAEDLGMIMSKDELDKLGAFNDVFEEFGKKTDALEKSLGLSLLPILTALFTAISAIPVPVLKTLVILASAVVSIMLIVKAIKSMTNTASTIKNFFSGFDMSTLKTTAIVLGVVAALIALGTVIAVIVGRGNDLKQSMASVGDSMSKVTSTVQDTQKSVGKTSYHASGTTNFNGGRTWVGEAGPELVELPQGSKIYNANDSKRMSGDTVNNYNITISASDIKEFNDIIRIVQQRQQANRRGVAYT